MATTLRREKGSALTFDELDNNFLDVRNQTNAAKDSADAAKDSEGISTANAAQTQIDAAQTQIDAANAALSESNAADSAAQAAADASSANGNPLGEYADSVTFNSHNDYVTSSGLGLFRLKETITPPYTTDTATYPLVTDDTNLVPWSSLDELETIARSLNIPKENIIYGTVGASIAANITHIYVSEQQTTYTKPADVPDGAVIVSIVDDVLETNLGTFTLLPLKIQGEYVQPVNDSYTMDEYLGNKGIFAATEQQIQDANDYIVSTGKRTKITLPQSAVIPFLSGITLDTSYVTLDANFSELDCTAMTTGTAITFTGTRQPPYYQNKDILNNLSLYGTGPASNVGGLLFSNPTSTGGEGPSHTVMNNVTVHSFGVGEEYKDRAYLTTANNCDVFNCGIPIKCSVANDGGENMRRFGGAIYNSTQAIEMNNPNGTLFLSGVSIDYCGKIANVTNGQVILSGCHVEAEDYDDIPITLSGNGSSVVVQNGWWLLSGLTTKSFDHWVDADANTTFRMSNTRMNNTRTATNEFGTGSGTISVGNLNSFNIHDNCMVLHSDRSKLIDGGFELTSIVDDIFITADTQPITDRHTGTNIQLAITTDDARTGLQSLEYLKNFGSGSLSEFILKSMPVTVNQQLGGRFYWRKPSGVSTGSLQFTFQFAKLQNDSNGVPVLIYGEAYGDVTTPLTASDTGWVEQSYNPTVWKAPSWATHFIVRVNGFGWGGGGEPIYFDDLTVDVVG